MSGKAGWVHLSTSGSGSTWQILCNHREPGSRRKEGTDTLCVSSFLHFIHSRLPDQRTVPLSCSVGSLFSVNTMKMISLIHTEVITGLSRIKLTTKTSLCTCIHHIPFFLASRSYSFLHIVQHISQVVAWCPVFFFSFVEESQTLVNSDLPERNAESVAFSFSSLNTAPFLRPFCAFSPWAHL